MKKILTILLLLLSVSIFAEDKNDDGDKTSFSITAGTEYLSRFYINFGASIIKPIEGNMEVDLKAALNLKTENVDGTVTPYFNIPFKVGINFLFPIEEKLTFLVGTGISPTITLSEGEKGFLIGPNLKIGVRYKIHPSMSLTAEVSESLLIGPPDWMYPSTEIVGGINFIL